MIKCFSRKLTNYLINNDLIDEHQRCFYQYGFEITLSTMLNIILILIISIIIGSILEGVCFLFTFITIRHLTGGYHANTYFSCNFWFAICYLSLGCLYKKTFHRITLHYSIIIIVFCLLIIVLHCPVENKNKTIPLENKRKLKLKAIILAGGDGTIALLLQVYSNKYGVLIVYTLLLVAILVIVATLQEKLKGGKKHGSGT